MLKADRDPLGERLGVEGVERSEGKEGVEDVDLSPSIDQRPNGVSFARGREVTEAKDSLRALAQRSDQLPRNCDIKPESDLVASFRDLDESSDGVGDDRRVGVGQEVSKEGDEVGALEGLTTCC